MSVVLGRSRSKYRLSWCGPRRKRGSRAYNPDMRRHLWSLMLLVAVGQVDAQSAPPRLEDLPRLAKGWSPAWAALVHDIVPPREPFEKTVLDKIDARLGAAKPTSADFEHAETVLVAALRHHRATRKTAPLA